LGGGFAKKAHEAQELGHVGGRKHRDAKAVTVTTIVVRAVVFATEFFQHHSQQLLEKYLQISCSVRFFSQSELTKQLSLSSIGWNLKRTTIVGFCR